MAIRQIRDAKDSLSGELIYFKGHAQAVYMSDGTTVEDAINNIEISGGGSIDTSNLATKTELAQKQDIISDIDTIRSNAANYKGTVTGVKINGTTKNPSSGVVDLGTVITSHQDISGKQDKLTSGTNIKTINSNSILGSGNISVGTITAIQANGTSVATSGVANIPAASTSKYGVTKLSSATNSTSTSLAATASAVKAAYDLANGKQDKLVSGTNIKTINGTSILGSGDITISGGSSDANIQAVDTGDVIDDVTVNYATKTYVDGLVGDINSILESIINGGGGVSLITFKIDNTEYQAEKGMTWEQWVNSEYNINEFYILNNEYIIYGPFVIVETSALSVSSSDVIKNINYYTYEDPSIIGPT